MLQRALHGGGEVAAARAAVRSVGARGMAGEAPARSQRRWRRSRATRGRQREARGAGLALHGAGGRRCTAHGGETEQRGWRKGKRADLKFPKIPRT